MNRAKEVIQAMHAAIDRQDGVRGIATVVMYDDDRMELEIRADDPKEMMDGLLTAAEDISLDPSGDAGPMEGWH